MMIGPFKSLMFKTTKLGVAPFEGGEEKGEEDEEAAKEYLGAKENSDTSVRMKRCSL